VSCLDVGCAAAVGRPRPAAASRVGTGTRRRGGGLCRTGPALRRAPGPQFISGWSRRPFPEVS